MSNFVYFIEERNVSFDLRLLAKHRVIAVTNNVRERPEKADISKILEVKDGVPLHKMEICFGD